MAGSGYQGKSDHEKQEEPHESRVSKTVVLDRSESEVKPRLQVERTLTRRSLPSAVPFVKPILEGVPVLQSLDCIQLDGIFFRYFREEFKQILMNKARTVFLRDISGHLTADNPKNNLVLGEADLKLILNNQGITNLFKGYHTSTNRQ